MKKKSASKLKSLWNEFKKFISRGNVVDMAVAVVIGGAFSTIVKTLTNILLSICTWGVPGGLSGLITVLPAVNANQKAPTGYENVYSVDQFLDKGFSPTEAGMYIQYGQNYYYKGCAIIDWGAFINAIITFIIIGLTLFVILKIYNSIKDRKKKIEERIKEEYYKKHPEARPVVEEKNEVHKPTEVELLSDIKDALISQGNIKKHAPKKIKLIKR